MKKIIIFIIIILITVFIILITVFILIKIYIVKKNIINLMDLNVYVLYIDTLTLEDILYQLNFNNKLNMILDKDVIIEVRDDKLYLIAKDIKIYNGEVEIIKQLLVTHLKYLKDNKPQTILDRLNQLNNITWSLENFDVINEFKGQDNSKRKW